MEDEERHRWLERSLTATRAAIESLHAESPHQKVLLDDLVSFRQRLRSELHGAGVGQATAREERVASNEMLFREVNERIRPAESTSEAREIDFVCECGDATCAQPVGVSFGNYQAVRADPLRFIVLPGHELPEFETIVARTSHYFVIEKNEETRSQVTTDSGATRS
jgi:hypothetical protein